MRWVLRLLALLTLCVVAAAVVIDRDYRAFLDTPLTLPEEGAVLLLETGSAYPDIVRQLDALGATHPSWRWRLLGRLRQSGPGGIYQAGEYQLSAGLKPAQLLNRIAAGDVRQYRFTIIEGWTVAQLRQALAEVPQLRHITRSWDDQQLADALGISARHPDAHPLEGWFLPETYDYRLGHSDLDLLKRAHQAMQRTLDEVWRDGQSELPLDDAYALLTLASIVEKETSVAEELSQVAGVFVRRLQRGMRLQTDPTVIYGLGAAFDGNLRRVHLRTDNPYNTYTRHGLPPSPIALPGSAAIAASLSPAAGEALYFVATGDGGHAFAATLAEHERNVDRYQRQR